LTFVKMPWPYSGETAIGKREAAVVKTSLTAVVSETSSWSLPSLALHGCKVQPLSQERELCSTTRSPE
jgi:hypothetical protein